jgi:outer membrane protein assembly factor BamD
MIQSRTLAFVLGTIQGMPRTGWVWAVALVLVAACRPELQLKQYTTNEALYRASLGEFEHGRWDNAVTGFDKLTTDLPARDTLLPRSYWYLAEAHQHLSEYLLAAQSFNRLVESFPDVSLADRSALEAARSYRQLWRKPELDANYGETALATYNTLLALYPTSTLVATARREIADLEDWFARKSFNAGVYYMKRKAYDSANIYFRDVLTRWPSTPTARNAGLDLVESYLKIQYRDDAASVCSQLRKQFGSDREVRESCSRFPETGANAAVGGGTRSDTIPNPR